MNLVTTSGLQIREYRREDLNQVAELQRFLMGPNIELNRKYLEWKYHQNPFSIQPRAIVALRGSDIVGFRGFVPTPWLAPGPTRFDLLTLADTCVHLNHRRQGLFRSMTEASLATYSACGFPAIINLSTSPHPAAGYIKMGWRSIGTHGSLLRTTPMKLLRVLMGNMKGLPASVLHPGTYGNLRVEDRPQPDSMASIASRCVSQPALFTLYRNVDFYNWRFRNPREIYRFAFLPSSGNPKVFLVLRGRAEDNSVSIVDWGATETSLIRKAILSLLGQKCCPSLCVWDSRPISADGTMWRELGFRDTSRLKQLGKIRRAPLPLLIRPTVPDPSPKDWVIEALAIDNIANWQILEACSDAG